MSRQINQAAVDAANTQKVLPAGYHPAMVKIDQVGLSGGGMPMITSSVIPLREYGDKSTALVSYISKLWITLPWIDDKEAQLENFRKKLVTEAKFAEKYASMPEKEGLEASFKVIENMAYQFTGGTVNAARVFLGVDVVPYGPSYSDATKSYQDVNGNTFSKDEVDAIRKSIAGAAVQALADAVDAKTLPEVTYCYINQYIKKTGEASLSLVAALPPGKACYTWA